MSTPSNQFRRDHPGMRFVLLDSSAGPVPSQAKVTHSLKLSLTKKSNIFRITLMSGLLLLVTERALLMSPKGRNASWDGLV